VELSNPLIFAPMAGVSHSPMRNLIMSFAKPGLFFSEMLSAKSLIGEDFDTSIYLKASEKEKPVTYQIFASNTEDAVLGCKVLLKGNVDMVDLNLSCPAPEIAKKRKAGAYLLNNLTLVEEMLFNLKKACGNTPLTVKIRLGKKEDKVFLKELCDILHLTNVNAVTIHPRKTTDKLKGISKWEYIGYFKSIAEIPVIGNGDVTDTQNCIKMFDETGCDGVMIGRAAVAKPWIFDEILNNREYKLTPEFLLSVYNNAVELFFNFFDERKALGRIKEFTWYFKNNMKFGHFFVSKIQNGDSFNEINNIIKNHFLTCC
jgi:nifR3 family TIM-barrel protein